MTDVANKLTTSVSWTKLLNPVYKCEFFVQSTKSHMTYDNRMAYWMSSFTVVFKPLDEQIMFIKIQI